MKTERQKHKIEAEVAHRGEKRKAGTEGKAKSNLRHLSHEDHHWVSQQDFLKTETPVATRTFYGPVSKVHSPLLSCRECPW